MRLAHDPLRFCMYTPSADGGHARYTHDLLATLASLDDSPLQPLEMSLVTCSDLDPRYRATSYAIHDILPPIVHRSTYRHAVTWAVSRASYYARRERAFLHWIEHDACCDGIHFQEYTPWLAPRHFRLLQARQLCLFFTVHNIRPHIYPPGMPASLYDEMNRRAWRLCDALFVHSHGLRDLLVQFLGPAHPPILVTPHGLWSVATPAAPVRSDSDGSRKQLLFFGTIRRDKGLHVLLAALRQLPDFQLTIAGAPADPRYAEQIRTLVAGFPPGQVRLLNRFVDDDEVATLFAESSVVVLPYTAFASQSGVLHDALTYRRPVVVTDVGALGESVRSWGVGEVTAPGDVDALATAIRRITEPTAFRAATSAIAKVAAELTWERAARMTANAYRMAWAARQVAA